jgi:hypothetical protein
MINLKDLEGGGSGGLIDSPFQYRPGVLCTGHFTLEKRDFGTDSVRGSVGPRADPDAVVKV